MKPSEAPPAANDVSKYAIMAFPCHDFQAAEIAVAARMCGMTTGDYARRAVLAAAQRTVYGKIATRERLTLETLGKVLDKAGVYRSKKKR